MPKHGVSKKTTYESNIRNVYILAECRSSHVMVVNIASYES